MPESSLQINFVAQFSTWDAEEQIPTTLMVHKCCQPEAGAKSWGRGEKSIFNSIHFLRI